MADPVRIEELREALRGPVVEPDDEQYDSARRVYNAMIDKRPRAIAQPVDAGDVMAAVNFARSRGLLLAVRGGGHNGAGFGTCNDGLVVDLCRMKGVRVDPSSGAVRAAGGCTQGEMDHAAHAFGLAVPAGIVSTTGIAGLTLGGGHGYLARKYGLTIDNLLEADVVLADGSFVTASASENQDLFWALRGGGGNFGIVTSFLYEGRAVSTVVGGVTAWDIGEGPEVMRWYREFAPAASDDLYGFLALFSVPPGPPFPKEIHTRNVCAVVWCYLGSPEDAEEAFRPVREFRRPLFHQVGPMPFTALQGLFDPLLPPGLQWYWKGDFVTELTDEAIEQHCRFGSHLPTPLSTMHLYPLDGAVHRVGRDESAFSYRDVRWSMVIAGIDPDPANTEAISRWAKDYWAAVHPYSAGGAYVNFMMEEGGERVRATYQHNYERLVAIKRRYDPDNLFRVNQNIQP